MLKEVMNDLWLARIKSLSNDVGSVKEGQQKYCETVYSRSGINHMWILKNSKDLLDNLKSRSFSRVSSTYDLCHYASKQFHNISVVPLLLQTESLSGE
jgi:hypothetical protein